MQDSGQQLGYVQAKLEAIHSDVKLLKDQVDDLRQESTGRRATTKLLTGGLGALSVIVGWLIHFITGNA